MKALKSPLAITAACLASLAACAPCFFTRSETIFSVGRGVAAGAGIIGATWADRLVATAFHFCGWLAADFLRATTVFLPVFAVLLLMLAIATRMPSRHRVPVGIVVGMVLLGIFINGACATFEAWCENPIRDIRLLAPVDLLQRAQKAGGAVFFNASAAYQVAAFAPELLNPKISQSTRAELAQSPPAWRSQDLVKPFSSVVICGALSDSLPLIDLLLASPNWHLELADSQGLLFRRGAGPGFRPPSSEAAPFSDLHEKAVFLARSALSFEAVGLKTDARDYIITALNLEPAAPDILIAAASVYASQGKWTRSRSMAERALKKSPDSPQAAYLRTLALLEIGAVGKAYKDSQLLLARQPEDVPTLLLNARTARAAHDPDAEIRSLEKLLAIAKARGVPEARIRIYLGQAWTQMGFPNQALENYRAALAGRLLPSEADEVNEAIQTIQRNSLPSSAP